jgi:hypothetical protein
MSEQQIAQDPLSTQRIERIWLNINNLEGSKDRLKVALEINGVERILFNTWVSDGNHGQSHNLTWVLNSYQDEIKKLRDALKDIAAHTCDPFDGQPWKNYCNEVASEALK